MLDDRKTDDDGSEGELDDLLLQHSKQEREEEAEVQQLERARVRQRRLSANQDDADRVKEMQHELSKDGVREDKAENELLRPDEEKESSRQPLRPAWTNSGQRDAGDGEEAALGDDEDADDATAAAPAALRVLPALAIHNAARARVGHPGLAATPRPSHSPPSSAPPHAADAPASAAPMELDSPARSSRAAADSSQADAMATEVDDASSPPQPDSAASNGDVHGSHADDGSVKQQQQRAEAAASGAAYHNGLDSVDRRDDSALQPS